MLLASLEPLLASEETREAIEAGATKDSCAAAEDAGVTVYRIKEIAHVLHSVTVEDIRYFFDEDFPVENDIPTANQNLTSEQRVLPYAPSIPSIFGFPSGRAFDFILQNNDDVSGFMIGGMSTLEKMGHAIHMQEMWHMISKHYKQINNETFDASKVCPCLEDEKNNGIYEAIDNFAELARVGMPEVKDVEVDDIYTNLENMLEEESEKEELIENIVKREAAKETLRSWGNYWPKEERQKRETLRSWGNYWPKEERQKRETLRSWGNYWPKEERQKRETLRSWGNYWPQEERQKRETEDSEIPLKDIVPELKDSKSWYYWKNAQFKMGHDHEFSYNAAVYFYCKINSLVF